MQHLEILDLWQKKKELLMYTVQVDWEIITEWE